MPVHDPDREQVVETMIALTRLSNVHRTFIAGDDRVRLYVSLRRHGFVRIDTLETCGIPRQQHLVGLISGQSSPAALEAALREVTPFLGRTATLAILVASQVGASGLKVSGKLGQLGFRIEAGVRCRQGLVLSAFRQDLAQLERTAWAS